METKNAAPLETVGNYRLLRPLGEGGMGMVFEAEHLLMGRRAAVKLLRRHLAQDPDVVKRLFNEARATSEIRHPGIVQIYDCGTTEDGTPWLIMELLQGETLAARLKRLGRLAPQEALDLALQAVSALSAAHAAGIVHRDLKPDNLFIVADPDVPGGERIKILDFGIAKLQSGVGPGMHQTRTGMIMGTPLYMSPEQCRGNKQVDARSDIYSFGIILYEMLAGRPPFISDGFGELLNMQLNEAPALLAERAPVGTTLAGVVHRALAKEPAQRQQDMTELQRALGEARHADRLGEEAGPRGTRGSGAPAATRRAPESPAPSWAATSDSARRTSTLFAPSATTLSQSTAEIGVTARARRRRWPWVVAGIMLVAGLGAMAGSWFVFGEKERVSREGPAPRSAESASAAPSRSTPPGAAPVAAAAAVAATPAVAAPAVAPPVAAAPPAQRDKTISWSIETTPSGARVVNLEDGKLLGLTPFHERFARREGEAKLRLEKKGFLPKLLTIPQDQDVTASARLDPAPAPAPTPAPPAGAHTNERIIKL